MDLFANYSDSTFAAQFEADGDTFLLRAGQTGVPVRLTPHERTMATETYRRLQFWLGWSRASMVALWLLAMPKETSGETRLLLLFVFIVVVDATSRWAFRSATKQFAGRKAVGPAHSRADVRVIFDRQVTWANIAWAALIGGVLTALWAGSTPYDVSWWVLLVGPFLLTTVPWGAWRKFRSG